MYAQAGQIGLNESFKFTSLIENIPVSENPFPDWYNLGFCRHYFNQLKTTQISYNAETFEVTFNDITDYSNYPSIGIGAHAWSFAQGTISNFSYFDDTQKFDYTTAGNKRLTNNVDMMAWSMRWVYLNFAELGYATNSYIFQEQKTLTIAQFMEFLDGTSTIDFTISGVTYNLHRSDFIDDYYYDIDDTHRIILFNYQFDGAWYFDGNTEQTRNYRPDYFLQSPYMLLNNSYSAITFGQNINVQSSGVCSIQYRNSVVSMYSGYSKNTLHGGETGHTLTTPIIGNATGKFQVTDPELSFSGSWKIISDESADRPTYVSLWRNASIYPFGILTASKFDDVYKNASLYRWTSTNVYGYGDGTNVWFPKIDINTNEYLLELIQGTQAEIEPQLPLWWKIGNIQANDFADNEKPNPEQDDDTDANPEIETGVIVNNNFTRPFSIANQFVTTYIMTGAQLSNLGRILWTSFNDDTVTMDMVENFWANVQQATGTWDISAVMNFIISLTMFPFDVTNLLPSTSLQSASELFIGTGKLGLDIKGSSNLYVANYAVGIADLGTVAIPETYGDYRDYANTVISVYLPYCGTVQLNPSDVVGKSISCKYAIDINSGECTAFLILVDNNTERYNLAIEKGMCGFSIPITSTNSAQVKTRLENNMLKSGSAMLSMLQGGLNVFETALTGDAFDIGNSVIGLQQSRISSKMLENSFLSQSGIGCNYISGATGFSDLACPSTAYVQIKRGIYSKPMHYKSTVGYPTNAKEHGKINDFSGYIKCVNADVSTMTCTEEEKSKIKSLLEDGVYV